MAENTIHRLSQLAGLYDGFHDVTGKHHSTSPETRRALLAAMGFGQDDLALGTTLAMLATEERERIIPPVLVVRGEDALEVAVRLAVAKNQPVRWTLAFEGGGERTGQQLPTELRATEHAGVRVFAIAGPMPHGYHELTVRAGEGVARALVIAAPSRAYGWASGAAGRVMGFTVQLYALRSARNFGVGDFTDLAQLVRRAAAVGADFVGVNPLHAGFAANPGQVSPYSPSNRALLNTLYIDPDAVPELGMSAAAMALRTARAFEAELSALRALELVDAPAVARVKGLLLRACHAVFREEVLPLGNDRAGKFERFQRSQGATLRRHAVFEALHEHFARERAGVYGFWDWPPDYREPESPAVRAFAETHRDEVGYHEYLQFLAAEQLAAAQEVASAAGMRIGLYTDLAVGAERGGSEVWSNQDIYAAAASVGCPPDPFSAVGQNWGLPPAKPLALRAARYQPFINVVRALMRGAGAVRLDHVMALHRLFWIPPGLDARSGAYVAYPAAELMAILALESERARCMVIGEDLGTVPVEVGTLLEKNGLLSYKVFLFENGADGRPKHPLAYDARALVVATTHDLPTLRGYWAGRDLALREAFGRFDSAEAKASEWAHRGWYKQAVLDALAEQGLLPAETSRDAGQVHDLGPALVAAIYTWIARTPCRLLGVQLEDVVGALEQTNVPGTVDEHPNWRRKLPHDLDAIFASDELRQIVAAIVAARPRV